MAAAPAPLRMARGPDGPELPLPALAVVAVHPPAPPGAADAFGEALGVGDAAGFADGDAAAGDEVVLGPGVGVVHGTEVLGVGLAPARAPKGVAPLPPNVGVAPKRDDPALRLAADEEPGDGDGVADGGVLNGMESAAFRLVLTMLAVSGTYPAGRFDCPVCTAYRRKAARVAPWLGAMLLVGVVMYDTNGIGYALGSKVA
jgi:hypothetical protein